MSSSTDKCTCEVHGSQSVDEPPAAPVAPVRPSAMPMGMFSFSTGFLFSALLTLHARGVIIPNIVITMLLFYGGIIQFIVGIYELVGGNTYAATLFCSYASFNFTYAGLYLPALGIAQAYILPDGTISPQFAQAVGLYLWCWFVVTMFFLIGSLRSSLSFVLTLFFTAFAFAMLGAAQFTGTDAFRVAGGSFSALASACGYWAAVSGFWGAGGAGFRQISVPDISLAYRRV